MDRFWNFPYPSQRMPVLAPNAVATSQPLAAQAGLRMLLAGGNAGYVGGHLQVHRAGRLDHVALGFVVQLARLQGRLVRLAGAGTGAQAFKDRHVQVQ